MLLLLMVLFSQTTPDTHNPSISTQTVRNHLQDIGERPQRPCNSFKAAYFIWSSFYKRRFQLRIKSLFFNLHDVMKTVGGVKIL